MGEQSEFDSPELLQALKAGDPEVWRVLYQAMAPRLLRHFRADDLAQEIVQETFIRAFEHIHGFNQKAKIETWLSSIAINVLRDLHKKESREREVMAVVAKVESRVQGAFRNCNPEELCSKELLRKALEELSLEDKEIFLRHLEGEKHQSIAESMGRTQNAIDVRIHRVKQRIREVLASLF